MSTKIISFEVVHGRNDPEIIEECHRIRKEVFHIEQKFPLDTEFDEVEHVAMHFLVRVTEEDSTTGERVTKGVGTIRGTAPDVYPAINRYKLSRLAVEADYRQHKLGRLLVNSLHNWVLLDAAATNRPAEVECHAQIPVIPFYEKFGFVPEGERFDEDGAPHQNMVARLKFPVPVQHMVAKVGTGLLDANANANGSD
ncbi:Glucosamine 6-phosphate N-acetyltransferase [Mycena indigotica]|uniref:Glucosamine 6-phosphate N-acetyltransferase n=1 Tax=Mycena indigotica TaxID=2126181 RepID=A0A8H6W1W0_9AGAR|nr:Glucosamine 6-phosphate N-acetyltransferase [Mycena indigotica]KAF7301952.1 Glucosamine 6-phosphate N-acetyltransferase [Mycena indigotica]